MRLLLLAVTLAALCAGSYWALTRGPFSPSGGGVEGIVAEVAATADAVLGDGGPAFTGETAVYTDLTRDTYEVTGATPEHLLQSLLARGPRSGEGIFFGLTNTQLDVHYDAADLNGGCIIRDVRLLLRVHVTLPRWTPPAGADPQMVADWGDFRRALEAHEDQHRQIAVDGAEKAHLAVSELYRPSCEDAENEARRRLERAGVETSAAHRAFDVETAHGKLDGARWPVDR